MNNDMERVNNQWKRQVGIEGMRVLDVISSGIEKGENEDRMGIDRPMCSDVF